MALRNNVISVAVTGLILLAVLLQVYEVLIPEVQSSGNALNATGAPLGSLFTSTGVVILVLMAALVLVVIRAFMPSGRK